MKRILPVLLLACSAAALAKDRDDDSSWVVVRSDRNVSMHGSLRDLEAARKHFAEFGPQYLWFRRDGKQYVVRDGKVIDQIEEATRPQEELGAEQARLGKRQADLGRQQAQLGRQQAELGERQARHAQDEARRQLRGEEPAGKEDDEREIDKLQRYLSGVQENLGREQEKVGREQEKMGREQERLSREVERKVHPLIEASLKDGSAKRMD